MKGVRPKLNSRLGNPVLENDPYTRNCRNFKTSNPSLVPSSIIAASLLPQEVLNNGLASVGNNLVNSKDDLFNKI